MFFFSYVCILYNYIFIYTRTFFWGPIMIRYLIADVVGISWNIMEHNILLDIFEILQPWKWWYNGMSDIYIYILYYIIYVYKSYIISYIYIYIMAISWTWPQFGYNRSDWNVGVQYVCISWLLGDAVGFDFSGTLMGKRHMGKKPWDFTQETGM